MDMTLFVCTLESSFFETLPTFIIRPDACTKEMDNSLDFTSLKFLDRELKY